MRRVIGSTQFQDANPFLLMDEFKNDDRGEYEAGFPMHPHKGFEIITYMKKGAFSHRDSSGHEGHLGEGGVQWITAGKGILHEELPEKFDGDLLGFQLWVNLPKDHKLTEPQYSNFAAESIPVVQHEGLQVKVIAGTYEDQEGPVHTHHPIHYLDVMLHGGEFAVEANEVNVIFITGGEVTIEADGEKSIVHEGTILSITDVKTITAHANEGSMVMLRAAALREPVVKYGPFVMNTSEEIEQAIQEYQNGEFAK
jgi:hypothetical protein